jgi:endonuclease/exonuclease/phosphatase family metal-dependent hydrolase
MTGEATPSRHDAAAERIRALRLIELRQPNGPPDPAPATLRVAAWNLERCTDVEASAAVLRRAGAAVALLSEMDFGMARSGNRHTARDLAGSSGAGYAFGVEFVELGLGMGRELVDHAGRSNAESLHGNAVVSALPFRDPVMIRLDRGGAWFGLDWHHRRIGGRMALGVTVELARGPVVLVSTHLENRSTPEDRRRDMERILATLDASAPGLPAVVAGDLNTAAMPDLAAEPGRGWFEAPAAREPLFDAMAAAGFDWRLANTPEQTRRHIPDGRPAPRAARIDWLFTRGLEASGPRTWPAVDDDGAPLSDHELITVDIA